MELKQLISFLENNSVFNDWQSTYKDYFLAHIFVMLDEANIDVWQLGFFDKQKNMMTTFVVDKNVVKIIPDQEILKSGAEITPLDFDAVKISEFSAMNIANNLLRTEYSREKVAKTFFILQQIDALPVYNITFFTVSFKTINIKISSVDGKIIHHSQGSIADFS